MPACQYKYESESPRIRFECNEPTITNGKFCFFHDEDHYDEYEEDAAKRFEEKLLESISENKSLLCIGYYLPNVNFLLLLGEKSLPQRAYFTKVTFYKGASFAFATFSEEVEFTKATFGGAADFHTSTFSEPEALPLLHSQKQLTLLMLFSPEQLTLVRQHSLKQPLSGLNFLKQ